MKSNRNPVGVPGPKAINEFAGHFDALRAARQPRQRITVEVERFRDRGLDDLVPLVICGINGVEGVERDPATTRLWVFGNGALEPSAIVTALASWGLTASVLENQFELPA